jgi:hypothetical protein
VIVEYLRVSFFLVCRKGENVINEPAPHFLSLFGGKGVTVPRLTFSRKGAHQVHTGLAFIKIHRHFKQSFPVFK